jgi:hypothetical protein
MSNHLSPIEDPDFYSSIQENLKQLSAQLGTPLDEASILEIYQNACDLLSHVSPSPLTLARVAGTLLVYRVKDIDSTHDSITKLFLNYIFEWKSIHLHNFIEPINKGVSWNNRVTTLCWIFS